MGFGFIARYDAALEEFKNISYRDREELLVAQGLDPEKYQGGYEWDARKLRMGSASFVGILGLIITAFILIGQALKGLATGEFDKEAIFTSGMAGGVPAVLLLGIGQLDAWLGARRLQAMIDQYNKK